LHLPYFEFRELPKPDPIDEDNGATNKQRPKPFLDLSFLDPEENKGYCIFKARFSLIICGSDYLRWTGYGFTSSEYDGLVELEPPEEDREEDSLADYCEEDLIAGACEVDENLPIVNANFPIFHPLEYFLVVFENRIAGVRKEWRNLVGFVKEKIEDYVCGHLSALNIRIVRETRLRYTIRRTETLAIFHRERPTALSILSRPLIGLKKR
jgi:hypothetical protein